MLLVSKLDYSGDWYLLRAKFTYAVIVVPYELGYAVVRRTYHGTRPPCLRSVSEYWIDDETQT